jgi:DNA ligase 1
VNSISIFIFLLTVSKILANLPQMNAMALLRDWQGSNPAGWLMSEKLDGWRVLWTGADYVTREGNVLRVPDSWKVGMPGIALDGELFAGRGEFHTIQRRLAGGCDGLTFHVFDVPGVAGRFRARAAVLASLSLPSHCRVVPQVRCKGESHLLEFADAIVAAGGEGAVIRNPRSAWQAGRSGDILRWVPQCPAINRC